ncbi:MAG TPA: hypothetical protein VFJ97_02840 [Dermatophilaceae bacterium]|nr:hypothetical protein [Dermatophilaceae bacterium]
MEMASFLAGERWSDHPACTHPLLAELARMVTDYSGDVDRQQLAPLIPDVIGLNGKDIRIDAEIALSCAQAALPVVAAERQRVLAAGILACERVLAQLDSRPSDDLRPASRDALGLAPEAWSWARRFSRDLCLSHRVFRAQSAPRIVALAVEGTATACVADPGARLLDMLTQGIRIVDRLMLRDDVAEAAVPTPGPHPRLDTEASVAAAVVRR